MKYEFPEIEMSEDEKIWLDEACRRYRNGEDLDVKVMKVS